ncbi:MAG: YdcF family protein [Gallionella sp.]|nr:YdcF family protein [Gallionella sp.]
MSWFATNLAGAFLLPPLSLLLILLTGILLLRKHPKGARKLIIASLVLLWLASTPYIAESALHILEAQTTPLQKQTPGAAAIVILGGGSYFQAPEYARQDTVSPETLVRLRYGARLQRELKLPILLTGGRPLGNDSSEADQMRVVLEQDFRVQAGWTEDASDNTFENARNSRQTLEKSGINRIYLVTHAWHMPRSAAAFRRAGFEVIEAPTAFTTRYRTDLLAFVPGAEGLRNSKIFAHEVIGLLWYQAKSLIFTTTQKEKA